MRLRCAATITRAPRSAARGRLGVQSWRRCSRRWLGSPAGPAIRGPTKNTAERWRLRRRLHIGCLIGRIQLKGNGLRGGGPLPVLWVSKGVGRRDVLQRLAAPAEADSLHFTESRTRPPSTSGIAIAPWNYVPPAFVWRAWPTKRGADHASSQVASRSSPPSDCETSLLSQHKEPGMRSASQTTAEDATVQVAPRPKLTSPGLPLSVSAVWLPRHPRRAHRRAEQRQTSRPTRLTSRRSTLEDAERAREKSH